MKNLKFKKLEKNLKKLKSAVVAYSGGLDSTFLLKMAIDTLGIDKVLAVTAASETYPSSEYAEARRIAKKIGARYLAINTSELEIKNFKENPVNRCYYCKKELFGKLDDIKKAYGLAHVVDGTNLDDLKDVRYGRKAAKELGVKSPLLEADITKDDIRKFSKRLKLSTWDKPSFACLASRIPFNSRIDKNILRRVEKSEDALRKLGFRQVRVRSHGDIARIEIEKKDFAKAVKSGVVITARLKACGFTYITLDLAGYRTGSLHEAV
jgi:uncharacterized protein